MCAVSKPASSIARSTASSKRLADVARRAAARPRGPASVGASTSWWRSSAGSTSSHVRHVSVKPCRQDERRPGAAAVRGREARGQGGYAFLSVTVPVATPSS